MMPGIVAEGDSTGGVTGGMKDGAHPTALPEVFSMYLSNISPSCTELYLKRIFEAVGSFHEWKGVTDPLTGKCGSFGLVSFSNSIACQRAVQLLNGLVIGEKALVVKLDPSTERRIADLSDKSGLNSTDVLDPGRAGGSPAVDSYKEAQERLATILGEQPRLSSTPMGLSRTHRGSRLDHEVEKWKVQYSQKERQAWIKSCVKEYFGTIDDDLVAYLSALTPADFERNSKAYQDLKLLFVQDLDTFLGRLNGRKQP